MRSILSLLLTLEGAMKARAVEPTATPSAEPVRIEMTNAQGAEAVRERLVWTRDGLSRRQRFPYVRRRRARRNRPVTCLGARAAPQQRPVI